MTRCMLEWCCTTLCRSHLPSVRNDGIHKLLSFYSNLCHQYLKRMFFGRLELYLLPPEPWHWSVFQIAEWTQVCIARVTRPDKIIDYSGVISYPMIISSYDIRVTRPGTETQLLIHSMWANYHACPTIYA